LSRALEFLVTPLSKAHKVRESHVLASNFAKYSLLLNNFALKDVKPFLIWLLTASPLLKYVAKLPCNLSLIACFATLVLQGSVATYVRLLITSYSKFTEKSSIEKKLESRYRFNRTSGSALGPGFVYRKVTTSAKLTQRSCCLRQRLSAAGPSLGSELAGTLLCGL